MKITLKETLKLTIFSDFKLIAGEKGLSRHVSRIGLLDHEMINPIKGQFVEGEFALSTLLAAKDNPDLILSSVKYLIESGASGLGVKDIYYKELPPSVMTLAERENFPVFMFGNTVYFEDVITEFKTFIDEIKHGEDLGSTLYDIVEKNPTEDKMIDAYHMTIGRYEGSYNGIYLRSKTLKFSEGYLRLKSHQIGKRMQVLFASVFKEGIFIIFRDSSKESIARILDEENFKKESDLVYGLSKSYNLAAEYGIMLNECLRNCRIADVEELESVDKGLDGIYQLIVPYHQEIEFQRYMHHHIDPIIRYDGHDNTTLFETLVVFVRNEGQIKATALSLNQHSNTIRYRLTKIKSLLDIQGSDIVLYERLSLAVRLYLLGKLEY